MARHLSRLLCLTCCYFNGVRTDSCSPTLCRGVDTLLTATYDPVLLAALAAPNAAVRLNALALLEGAYPIQV